MTGAYGLGTPNVSPSPFTPWNPYASAYGSNPIHQVFHLLQIVPQQLQQLQQLNAVQQQQIQQLQQVVHLIPTHIQQLIASSAQQQPSPFQSPLGQVGLGALGGISPFGIGQQAFGVQPGHVM